MGEPIQRVLAGLYLKINTKIALFWLLKAGYQITVLRNSIHRRKDSCGRDLAQIIFSTAIHARIREAGLTGATICD